MNISYNSEYNYNTNEQSMNYGDEVLDWLPKIDSGDRYDC